MGEFLCLIRYRMHKGFSFLPQIVSESLRVLLKTWDAHEVLLQIMKINDGVFSLLENMDQLTVIGFISIFRVPLYFDIQVEISYVGVRKAEQWKVFNTAILEVEKLTETNGTKKQEETLADLNRKISEYVAARQSEYTREAIALYSNVDTYITDELDKLAENLTINEEIKTIKERLALLKNLRDANRQKALMK